MNNQSTGQALQSINECNGIYHLFKLSPLNVFWSIEKEFDYEQILKTIQLLQQLHDYLLC
jgi:hypothetical protein